MKTLTSEAYEGIRQGLLEAIEFAQGKPTGARVHYVDVQPDSRAKPLSAKPGSGKIAS